ncbi:MAG TPA: MotA/TolQ/ExbB proton channel family protein [Capillimicrobium sp.]
MALEQLLLDVANALRYPVIGLALLALIAVVAQAGAFVVELAGRRGRSFDRLERAATQSRAALEAGDRETAIRALTHVASDAAMLAALSALVGAWGRPGADDRAAKLLADFDLASQRRLERSRLLVRAGPALGLMGTLIPLSPALAALGDGDVEVLAEGLRVAFGVTVVGILVGMVAFGLSLVRDRLYAQDHSDLEYVAAVLFDQPPPVDDRAPDALAVEALA